MEKQKIGKDTGRKERRTVKKAKKGKERNSMEKQKNKEGHKKKRKNNSKKARKGKERFSATSFKMFNMLNCMYFKYVCITWM